MKALFECTQGHWNEEPIGMGLLCLVSIGVRMTPPKQRGPYKTGQYTMVCQMELSNHLISSGLFPAARRVKVLTSD